MASLLHYILLILLPLSLFQILNATEPTPPIPQFSYFQTSSATPINQDLPSPRLISNTLCTEPIPILDPRRLNALSTFFGQFLDHTIISTPTNKSEPFPIPIPADDPLFANQSDTGIPFFRSIRATLPNSDIQRPINDLTSAVDLASVYGVDPIRRAALRAFERGQLRTSQGDLLPINTDRLPNAPHEGRRFFLAGDHRANEHPVLTSLHTLFMREHNSLADEIATKFPDWDDDRVFEEAKRVNIAQMQRIVYEEWFPAMTGTRVGRYVGQNGGVSVLFAGAGFRVGHSMVGGEVERRGSGGVRRGGLELKEVFFGGLGLLRRRGVDEFVRGAAWARARKLDLGVDVGLRNFLFRGVNGVDSGIDLVALNLQRCRDHGCPSYNEVREWFGRRKARGWADITGDVEVQERLREVYGEVDRVEAWIGLVAEDHMRGSSMGPTLIRVWRREFGRLKALGEYFRESEYFGSDIKREVGRVRRVLNKRGSVFKELILRNSDIEEDELPEKMFFVE